MTASQPLSAQLELFDHQDVGPEPDSPPRKVPETPPAKKATRGGRRALSFLKWVGGKTQSAKAIVDLMPDEYGTYYEPMVGAGAVFLTLRPERAVLSDVNAELVQCWTVVRDRVDALIEALGRHCNTKSHYLALRATDPDSLSPVEAAARTIFLNKTGFNGLYRLNKKGRFNVPYGRNPQANFRDTRTLRRVSRRLQNVEIRQGDFAEVVADAEPGSLIYFDPPYFTPDRHSRFYYYHPDAFLEADHRRLAEVFGRLDERGCHVVLSNSDYPFVRQLYSDYSIEVLGVSRLVNVKTKKRMGWSEVVIHNGDRR